MNLVPLAGFVFLLQSLSECQYLLITLPGVPLLYCWISAQSPAPTPSLQHTYLLLSSLLTCQSLSPSAGALGVLSKEGKKERKKRLIGGTR